MEKMTIHRGLSELKLIDSKIEKQIAEIIPTGIYQKEKLIAGYIKQDDFQKDAESKYKSINDLIERKGKIKSAIVQANAKTMVMVGNVQMSIADAINKKASVKFKKQLVSTLKQKHLQVIGAFNKGNETVSTNLQNILVATFGKDQTKVSATDIESVSKPYIDMNGVLIFDPLKVESKVTDLENEVAEFEANVDAVLSEINATTHIEF